MSGIFRGTQSRVEPLLPRNKNQESNYGPHPFATSFLSLCRRPSAAPCTWLPHSHEGSCRHLAITGILCTWATQGNPLALSLIQFKIPRKTKLTIPVWARIPCLVPWQWGHTAQTCLPTRIPSPPPHWDLDPKSCPFSFKTVPSWSSLWRNDKICHLYSAW